MSTNLTAVVLVNDPPDAQPIMETLSRKGFAGVVRSDPGAFLDTCKVNPPDLVIVEDRLSEMTGREFLTRLVRIAWATATILIIDDEEESVHDLTEGLGILGHMRNVGDADRLEKLLDKGIEIIRCSKMHSEE
jgi:DNA-binding response OmpR family regulator